MATLKLTVQVQPWKENDTQINGFRTRQETIRPWLEICETGLRISELMERIAAKFERIHRGKGKLNIECLEDGWGDTLDGDYTVGDCFEDRTREGVNVKAHTVLVRREPPCLEDLHNPARFTSLAPESSARPQKRQRGSLLGVATVGQYGNGYMAGVYDYGHKRQRVDVSTNGQIHDPDRPLLSSERDLGLNSRGSHPSGYQVADSQRSPRREQPNGYSTPQSVSLSSPNALLTSGYQGVLAIPDSPAHRVRSPVNNSHTAQGFGDEEPKSESPELESQVYSVPHSNVGTPNADESLRIRDPFLKPSLPLKTALLSHPSRPNHVAQSPQLDQPRLKTPERPALSSSREGRLSRPSVPQAFSRQYVRKSTLERQLARDIYDPIETDVSSQDILQVDSKKRPKQHKQPASTKSPNPRHSGSFPRTPSTPLEAFSSTLATKPIRGTEALGSQANDSQYSIESQRELTDKRPLENNSQTTETTRLIRQQVPAHTRPVSLARDKTCDAIDLGHPPDGSEPQQRLETLGSVGSQEENSDKLSVNAQPHIENTEDAAVSLDKTLEASEALLPRTSATKQTQEQKAIERKQKAANQVARQKAERLATALSIDRKSLDQSRRSSSSVVGSEKKRKSATPIFPGNAPFKPSSLLKAASNPLGDTPSRTNLDVQMPLPSALRSSPSAPRRSVSFAEHPVEPTPSLNQNKSVPTGEALVGSSNGTTTKSSGKRATGLGKLEAKDSTTSKKTTRKPRDTPKAAMSNEKIQLKLNLTRDKGKGRLQEVPPVAASAGRTEVVTVSDEDESTSSHYSRDEKQTQAVSARAGPSSRSRSGSSIAVNSVPFTAKPEAWMKSLSMSTETSEAAEKAERKEVAVMEPTHKSVSPSDLRDSSRSNTSSRSPARYVSSSSDSESETGSEEAQVSPTAKSPEARSISTNGEETMLPDNLSKDTSLERVTTSSQISEPASIDPTDSEVSGLAEEKSSKSQAARHSSADSESSQSSSDSGEEVVEDEAEQQLHRESRQLTERSQSQGQLTPRTPSSKGLPHVLIDTNTKSTSTTNGTRSAYARFPSMTGLKRNSSRKDTNEQTSGIRHPGLSSFSRRADERPNEAIYDGSTSSTSSEDNSSSEGDDSADEKAGDFDRQARKKSQGKRTMGFNGLLKIARKLGSQTSP
ncbi:hypothetical protein MMC06_001389 [Schaereria dolodes]|nr:hypothetical protein [Schaereria dolodes]